MTQHNFSLAPSTSPSTLRSNPPPANVRVPTIKLYSAYVNQVVYVCGEADSKMHLVSNNSTPPGPFPDIDPNFRTRALNLAGLLALHFTDNSHAFLFSKAMLGSGDWVLSAAASGCVTAPCCGCCLTILGA